jgi:hypothetical protein
MKNTVPKAATQTKGIAIVSVRVRAGIAYARVAITIMMTTDGRMTANRSFIGF